MSLLLIAHQPVQQKTHKPPPHTRRWDIRHTDKEHVDAIREHFVMDTYNKHTAKREIYKTTGVTYCVCMCTRNRRVWDCQEPEPRLLMNKITSLKQTTHLRERESRKKHRLTYMYTTPPDCSNRFQNSDTLSETGC